MPSSQSRVAVSVGSSTYASSPPFHPPTEITESLFAEHSSEPNAAYLGVRECFRLAGLDIGNYGTEQWNPLGGLIRPSETVLLKPNLVKESHPRDPNGWQ